MVWSKHILDSTKKLAPNSNMYFPNSCHERLKGKKWAQVDIRRSIGGAEELVIVVVVVVVVVELVGLQLSLSLPLVVQVSVSA